MTSLSARKIKYLGATAHLPPVVVCAASCHGRAVGQCINIPVVAIKPRTIKPQFLLYGIDQSLTTLWSVAVPAGSMRRAATLHGPDGNTPPAVSRETSNWKNGVAVSRGRVHQQRIDPGALAFLADREVFRVFVQARGALMSEPAPYRYVAPSFAQIGHFRRLSGMPGRSGSRRSGACK